MIGEPLRWVIGRSINMFYSDPDVIGRLVEYLSLRGCLSGSKTGIAYDTWWSAFRIHKYLAPHLHWFELQKLSPLHLFFFTAPQPNNVSSPVSPGLRWPPSHCCRSRFRKPRRILWPSWNTWRESCTFGACTCYWTVFLGHGRHLHWQWGYRGWMV